MANRYRFRILELSAGREMNITELSKALNLSYTKCSDYVRFLEREGLVKKTKRNKEVFVTSIVIFERDRIEFLP